MPTHHAPPTLEDVAKQAGVSTATVSRCLNTSQNVSPKSRKRVMEAVEQLGYTPNFGARVMAAKRTFTIGAIIPTMENAIFARGIQAFQEQLQELGYTLLVASNAYRPDVEEQLAKSLVARGADCLLLIGYERSPAVYDFLTRRGIPTLVTWAYSDTLPLPAVGFDNKESMRTLTQAVLDFGHRRLGVISGITDGNDRASARLDGIVAGLSHAGLSLDGNHIVQIPYGIENGAQAFEQLMNLPSPPTAVLCGNDVLAAGALSKAREMGIAVPGDVSITGFDDIELAQVVHPALTTVHVPHRQMGQTAATLLIDMLESGVAAKPVKLESVLKMRASLGPVPSNRP